MPDALFPLVVRTPHREVLRDRFEALRVPTVTGGVGVLARAEPCVLTVEPGLVVARRGDETILVGTAGGLLRVGPTVTLLSPLAVVGTDGPSVQRALAALSRELEGELDLRRRVESLERGLFAEARRARGPHAGVQRRMP